MSHCVVCGSIRIERKPVEVRLRNGRTVRGIEAEVCLACGERYYDVAAMEALEAARGGRRRNPESK